jgi:hypothetical protein
MSDQGGSEKRLISITSRLIKFIKDRQSREGGNIGYTRRRKTKQKHNTICVGHHYAQTNINNVNAIAVLKNMITGKTYK